MLLVEPIRCLTDNYAYFLKDTASNKTAVVDPSEAGPVEQFLGERGEKLDFIFNTHHHWDHVGGNLALKRATGCEVITSAGDRRRVAGADAEFRDGQTVELGESLGEVQFIPGHTAGHVALWFSGARVVFTGDTLFALGCGRLFEGDAEMMWRSLQRLRALPADTQVYCGHEYTLSNALFARMLSPDDSALIAHVEALSRRWKQRGCTLPTLLGEEVRFNPFLRADDTRLAAAVGLPGAPGWRVFGELRRRKDDFTE